MLGKITNIRSLNLIIDIWQKLNKKRKMQIILLFIFSLLNGLAELINLSAVVPFLLIITDPVKIWDVPLIPKFASFFDISNQNDLIVPITLLFAFTALISGVIRIFNLWLNIRLSAAIGNDFSREAYRKTLLKPYLMHVKSNSSAILNGLVNNVPVTVKLIDRILTVLTAVILVISILVGLLIFNKQVTFSVLFLLLFFYFCFSNLSKLKLLSNSKVINKTQKQQIKVIQESLSAIKDLIIFNRKKIYFTNYKKLDKLIRNLNSENRFLSSFPRYGIESLALFILIVSSIFLRSQEGFKEETLLILGVFALAAQRLLPNLQIIFIGLSYVRSNSSQTLNILEILNQRIPRDYFQESSQCLKFNESIKFENIFFKYNSNEENIIKGLNLELQKGERIGIIGKTGSGKSTIIDILLGLIKPTKGKFLVDGVDIHDPCNPEELSKWQNLLTYVPQDIFLTDNSFMENIAYGLPLDLINNDAVIECAKNARIHEFIQSTSNGYQTFVGERGIKLSGGQIQRIGIARALYKKSEIIIFDEATSALDNETELEVINSIRNLKKDFTIIMIAHRLNTLNNCNRIIEIEAGKVKKMISPSDLN